MKFVKMPQLGADIVNMLLGLFYSPIHVTPVFEIQLPAKQYPNRQQMKADISGFLPIMWQTGEILDPSFHLAQPWFLRSLLSLCLAWLLWAFEELTSGWSVCVCAFK